MKILYELPNNIVVVIVHCKGEVKTSQDRRERLVYWSLICEVWQQLATKSEFAQMISTLLMFFPGEPVLVGFSELQVGMRSKLVFRVVILVRVVLSTVF